MKCLGISGHLGHSLELTALGTNSIDRVGCLCQTDWAVGSKEFIRFPLAHIKVVMSRAPQLCYCRHGFMFLFWKATKETVAADDLQMKRVSGLKWSLARTSYIHSDKSQKQIYTRCSHRLPQGYLSKEHNARCCRSDQSPPTAE